MTTTTPAQNLDLRDQLIAMLEFIDPASTTSEEHGFEIISLALGYDLLQEFLRVSEAFGPEYELDPEAVPMLQYSGISIDLDETITYGFSMTVRDLTSNDEYELMVNPYTQKEGEEGE
jgi:hypothetical protein